MLSSFFAQWKMLFLSLGALVVTITPTPPASQSFSPNAPNVPLSSGTSRNWSGYSATNGQFTTVTGTWIIPTATGNGHTSADATWVGIGGIKSTDLIQSGTQNIIAANGQVTTTAFYELLPDVSRTIALTVKAGDSITVTITQQSTNQWQIIFTDNSTGQNYQLTSSYTSSLSSAEWIEEAPSNGHSTLPLDNFTTVQFTNGSDNLGNISQSSGQTITMVNSQGQALSITSSLNSDEASFSITRSSAVSTSPVTEFDRNPRGFRRHGFGIGSFREYPEGNRIQYRIRPTFAPTITPIPDEPTPVDTGTQSANIRQRRFRITGRDFPGFFQFFHR